MLQKLDIEQEQFQSQPDRSYLLRPSYYWELFKRRVLYFLLPFVLVLAGGVVLTLLWPATYLSSGKILVTTQQIPTELVRPTVTTLAHERIQVIQQRVLTRDGLISIATKFGLYPGSRNLMSATELTDQIRKNILIFPLTLGNPRGGARDVATIAFTVGFIDEDPRVATQVANELMTRILTEDLRDRTARAVDTTRFLTKEFQRLNEEYAAVEAKIAQAKRAQMGTSSDPQTPAPLAQLRAEYLHKSQIYSQKHPVLQTLKRQLEAFEKAAEPAAAQVQASAPQVGLEALEAQQTSLQRNLEETSRKLAAARLGETLERDQQSEKFEVIEQPSQPQEAHKPNRPKMLGITVALAVIAGIGLAFVGEMFDRSIRRSSDLMSVASADLIISIPYITTAVEKRRNRRKAMAWMVATLVAVVGIAVAAIVFMPPLELLVTKARLLLFR
jgi:uncharacterized protein involved in exopolysaccharide biosynthesis